VDEVADDFDAPITDVTFHDGWLFVSHLGKITRVRTDGSDREDVVDDLPSMGDHSNTEIVFGPDGNMYFGVGSATNSGVVGLDNLSWVERFPDFHDIPGDDITVRDVNYETENPLEGGTVMTGAYHAFGEEAGDREPIDSDEKCNGSILVYNFDEDDLDVMAWGFRNPFGLGFDADGKLWTINNGMDERGSRPVESDPDAMFQVERANWYGWPDYSIGRPVNQPLFAVDGVIPELVLMDHPELSDFAEGFAHFEDHVSANKFDFSSSEKFRFEGDAFVAETGSIPVGTGAPDLLGYRVTRVDMDNGDVSVFLANRSGRPAMVTGEDGINKPIDAKFHPDHNDVLFVVDFGAFLPGGGTEEEFPTIIEPETGAIYAIARGNVGKALEGIPGAGRAIAQAAELEGGEGESAEGAPAFNASAAGSQISFDLGRESAVTIRIYDLAGRLVRTLADQTMAAGRHEAAWDGYNNQGKKVLSGVYLYRIEAGGEQKNGKIVIAR
jgi:glucose/arabinose dehydrogenase